MKYKFTRVVAHIEIAFGVLTMIAGIAVTAAALTVPASWLGDRFASPIDRSIVALAAFVVGLAAGASSIVAGQITLVFLDIARRVARIDRRQRRWGQDLPPDDARWINRLRQR